MPESPTRTTTAFAPAHVTGFFFLPAQLQEPLSRFREESPGEASFDQLMARARELRDVGSVGAGLSLELGMKSEVEISFGESPDPFPTVSCFYNHQRHSLQELKLSSFMVKTFLKRYHEDPTKELPVQELVLRMDSPLPLKAGFGMSGAAALSVAFALNGALELGLGRDMLGSLAHLADCWFRGGLGDVAGQLLGGFEHRERPGLEGIVKLPPKTPDQAPELFILTSPQPLETQKVLSDQKKMAEVRAAGERANQAFSRDPRLENFFSVSYQFSKEAQLIPPGFASILEELNAKKGCKATPAHLGNTLIAMGDMDSILGLFNRQGRIFRTRVGFGGTSLL